MGIIFPLAVFSIESLRFSQEAREFFGEELHLLNKPLQQKENVKAKVKIEPFFCEDGTWKLLFEFPEMVTFEEDISAKSIYIRFNQGIDSPDLQNVQEKLSYITNRFANGYNTLYITGERPLFFHTERSGKTFELDITPDLNAPQKPTRSFEIANARLFVEERNYKQADNLFAGLSISYPKDKDVGVWHSSLEGLYPRWQKQVDILETLHDEYPYDEDVQTLLCDAWTPHLPYLLYERQIQDTLTLAVYQINRVQGEALLTRTERNAFYLGAQYQLWRGHISGVVNSQGETVGFKGTRNQGALYVRSEQANGGWLAGWLYTQEGNFYGGTGQFGCLVPPLQGNFWIRADYQKPYWELFETLAFHGREDRVECHLDSVYNRYINWEIGGGARRVGIKGVPDGYTSLLANAELFINVIITNPIFALNYGLDAEYVLHRKKEIGADGQPFNPVSLTSFEYHSIRGYMFYTWSDRVFFNFFAGETFNRLGINSPTFGAELKYVNPCYFEWLLSAAQIPSATTPGFAENFFTMSVTGRF